MSVSTRLYKQSNRLPKYTPLSWREYFTHILKKDVVLWIALFLGGASCLFCRPPLAAYAEYIDGKTLACLGALMTASGGFMISGIFDLAAARLVNACRSARALASAMILCTFLSSMVITNDVALIVFVPMTLLAFRRAGIDPMATVILQTVAANVGSILLPMGNPQNLYLYSRYHMVFTPFFMTVLPLSLAGLATLGLFCLFLGGKKTICAATREPAIRRSDAMLYSGLFLISALAVFDVFDYRLAVLLALVVMTIKGRNLVQQVDYALLLTFIGFFLFVGNVAHIPEVVGVLRTLVEPRPFLAAVLSSQIISNVPAAVMLSGFTDNYQALLAGVSAGGCGTLIASMASLISYKLYVRDGGGRKRYLTLFTLINILFLAVMSAAYLLTAA